jgi:hypothetical protein
MASPPTKKKKLKAKPGGLLFERFGLKADGGWAEAAAADLEALAPGEREAWLAFFEHAAQVKPALRGQDWSWTQSRVESAMHGNDQMMPGEAPTPPLGSDGFVTALRTAGPHEAWMAGVAEHVAAIGADPFRAVACRWLREATRSSTGHLNRNGPNREILRALIWATGRVHDDEVAEVLRQLALFATRKRTNQGTTAAAVLALAESKGSLAALALLADEAKRPSPRQRFARLAEHVRLRLGVTPEEAAEAHVPTYGFDVAGRLVEEIGGARVELRIEGGDVIASWHNEKGTPVKSVPAVAKAASPEAVKRIKAISADAEAALASQRDRLDRLMRLTRTWPYETWRQRYVDHPLVGRIARRLVWLVDDRAVEVSTGQPRRVDGSNVNAGAASTVALWHPVHRPTEEVVAWRRRLRDLGVTQPFKQAHREIYLLTDAERTTGTYSNRFAGHFVKQHQFAALSRGRGWEYNLLGNWDAGGAGEAKLALPADRLRVEFRVRGAGNATTERGIHLYVSTDQIRFYAEGHPGPVALEQVPPLTLSEVMRDADLFVGVASVGNDPNWHDAGPDRPFQDYWQQVGFGELSATAATRREVLTDLLPRLKIRDRVSLSDRFLVVRGDVRTYKIHLGSGNILMEPDDRYLCIVPGRSAANAASDGDLFLPFEGDSTLALILSKAMMLADDAKIADLTIVRQIRS